MKPDIVVYIRNGDNEELRYAIRSWCKNVSFNRLIAVGGSKPPRWFRPDIYIENASQYGKVKQAYDNIRLALRDPRITENILLAMDDVFVLQPLGDWPENFNFNRGSLRLQLGPSNPKEGEGSYFSMIKRTLDALSEQNYEPVSFEEHALFWCNRAKMLKIFDVLGKDIYSVLPRSLYANIYKCKTDYKPDFKAMNCETVIPQGEIFVSTNDTTFKTGKTGYDLRSRFYQKSRYEL